MPPALLDSQLATLEVPDADEQAFAVDVALPPDEIVTRTAQWLSLRSTGGTGMP